MRGNLSLGTMVRHLSGVRACLRACMCVLCRISVSPRVFVVLFPIFPTRLSLSFVLTLPFIPRSGHPCYGHIGEKVARALGVADDKDNIGTGIRDANVVVVGNGNVALDCARVLAKAGNGLYHTDLAARALTILGDGVTNVSIVGRRGHMQGAFTIKELRELVNLESEGYNTSFVVQEDELDMGATESSIAELNGPQGRPKTRINQLLRETAAKCAYTDNRVP